MEEALERMIDASLRRAGFSGSLPHLRRRRPDRIDLISFQFHSAGGSFVVEVAQCGPDGLTTSWGKHLSPGKVTAQYLNPPNRPRIGGDTFPIGDHWYVFGLRSYEISGDQLTVGSNYDEVAAKVLSDIERQAEPYWAGIS
jgi:hypothetical protein